MEEVWKEIEGYEGIYKVSNLGRVKSLERFINDKGGLHKIKPKFLTLSKRKDGYVAVRLSKNGVYKSVKVHRLVASAFIPNPDNKPQIDHIDTNRENNCVENLRWVTPSENCRNPLSLKNYSQSHIGHPNYLKHHSAEARAKISQANRNRVVSEETRKKLSEAFKGRVMSEEHRRKLSEAKKGKKIGLVNGKRVWYDPKTTVQS